MESRACRLGDKGRRRRGEALYSLLFTQKMNHEEIRERLGAFCDGELPEKERVVLSAHLSGCAKCRQTCEDWKRIAAALFIPSAISPSESFVSRVMEKLEAGGGP